MGVTVSNLLMGPAELFAGIFGATEPADAEAAITTPFRDLGGTDGGATATISQTYTPMVVDQIAMPVGSRKTEQSIRVSTSLAEGTLENLRLALNDIGTGTTLELDAEISNAEPNYSAIILRGQKPGGGPRLVIVRRCLSVESIGMEWKKDGKTMIPVTFEGYYVSKTVKAVKIDDTASA